MSTIVKNPQGRGFGACLWLKSGVLLQVPAGNLMAVSLGVGSCLVNGLPPLKPHPDRDEDHHGNGRNDPRYYGRCVRRIFVADERSECGSSGRRSERGRRGRWNQRGRRGGSYRRRRWWPCDSRSRWCRSSHGGHVYHDSNEFVILQTICLPPRPIRQASQHHPPVGSCRDCPQVVIVGSAILLSATQTLYHKEGKLKQTQYCLAADFRGYTPSPGAS